MGRPQVRHGAHMYSCRLAIGQDGCGRVTLDGSDQGLAAGQSVVFYDGLACLGSAVILPQV